MRIGEMSRRSGVSVRMLRYYEARGLLRPGRLASGYRVYGPGDLETVRRIRMLNEAGLPLGTIVRILPCVRSDGPRIAPCAEFRDGLRRRIADLDQRIAALAESRRLLSGYLGT